MCGVAFTWPSLQRQDLGLIKGHVVFDDAISKEVPGAVGVSGFATKVPRRDQNQA